MDQINMSNIKLYIILLLTTLSYLAHGQAKLMSIPINFKGDTSIYFEHTIKESNLLKLQDLSIAKDSFRVRIWTDKQCIDIVNNNNKLEATNYFLHHLGRKTQQNLLYLTVNPLNPN